jgi:hypothetical protein
MRALTRWPNFRISDDQAARRTRELPIRRLPFLVIYRIRGEVVEINRILHGAQNWP